jgi:hypothetical protein
MNQHDEHTDNRSHLGRDLRQYIEKRIQLLSLTISEQVSLVIAQSFQKLAGLLLFSSAILFLWLAVAFFLADFFGNTGLGFLTASIPLFIAGFIFINTKSEKLTERIQAELVVKVMEGIEQATKPVMKEEEGEKSGEE